MVAYVTECILTDLLVWDFVCEESQLSVMISESVWYRRIVESLGGGRVGRAFDGTV
jgi:hypothetical protein